MSEGATQLAVSFEAMAAEAMTEVRSSIGLLLEALPGGGSGVSRAIDVERVLGVDKKLAWQVFRLSRSVGLSGVADVPLPGSVRRLLAAARRCQIPEAVIERTRASFERFEQITSDHAGDRDALLSIISNLGRDTSEAFELKMRKWLFRGNAHVWGVQVQMQLWTAIVHREPGSEAEDMVTVIGSVGLQRLRQGEPLSVSSWVKGQGWAPDEPSVPPPGAPDDLGLELLVDFCSQPLPRMKVRAGAKGGVQTELVFPPSGRPGAVTLYMSRLMRDCRNAGLGYYGMHVRSSTPTEVLVLDLMVPRGATIPGSARATVYGRRPEPEHVYEMRDADRMPQRETLAYIGQLENAPAVHGAPRYQEAIRHALDQRGWLGTRFDVYRCRVEYPVLYSLLSVRADMANR